MRISALIPAKGFSRSKQRLSSLLDAGARALLAEAMLRDVLGQVVAARGLEAVYVVTGDRRVAEIGAGLGARIIFEPEERGETEAVLRAQAELKRAAVQAVLVVPGDIPLVRAGDFELLLEAAATSKPPFALLVPSHDRLGTNAMLLSPPDAIAPRFGHDSFTYHLDQAARSGLEPRIVENERIALDIDEPRDLERFLSMAADGESCREARRLGLGPTAGAERSGRP